jgi:hypothetical protein
MSETTNKGYALPVVGASYNQWGNQLNGDLTTIDTNLGGVGSVSVAGNTNVTASASQAQNLVQQLTGALTGDIEYILPPAGSFYIIENLSSGNFNILITTGAGNGVYAPQGLSSWVYCDGTNIIFATPQGWQEIATYTANSSAGFAVALPTIFRKFRLNLVGATVGTLGDFIYMSFSSNNGSTYYNTNYIYMVLETSTAGTSTPGSNIAATEIVLTPALNPVAGTGTDGSFEIWPGSAELRPVVRGTNFGFQDTDNYVFQVVAASLEQTVLMNAMFIGAVNINTLLADTFSGTFILEGLP